MAVSSPEDICNQALQLIGYKRLIGNMLEGTIHSRIALQHYGQTRDEVLRERDWKFAGKTILALTQAKTAVGNTNTTTWPPRPWLYSYTFPTDCIWVRNVLPPPANTSTPAESLDPRPLTFDVISDTGVRVIVCNIATAGAAYTARITDPAQFDDLFTSNLVMRLARKFTVALATEMPRGHGQPEPQPQTEERDA